MYAAVSALAPCIKPSLGNRCVAAQLGGAGEEGRLGDLREPQVRHSQPLRQHIRALYLHTSPVDSNHTTKLNKLTIVVNELDNFFSDLRIIPIVVR